MDTAERARSLTERLVALPSATPAGERALARHLLAEIGPGLEAGDWSSADGRAVVCARLRGRSPRTALLLAHYDTVGVDEFEALGDSAGAAIAFDPRALRQRLLAGDPERLPEAVRQDLEVERQSPGTWLFGRGALDMKSGLAAGLAALEALAVGPDPPNTLLVACPDEENQSAGMFAAVAGVDLLRRGGERFAGALNLDYAEAPVAYDGVAGKIRVALTVFGVPTHAGNPFGGVDAIQAAATVVTRLTTSAALTEDGGTPPVALRLRDRKERYDVQTAAEAEVEINLITRGRPLEATLDVLRSEIAAALEERARAMAALRPGVATSSARVITWAELARLAPPGKGVLDGGDVTVRGRTRAAGLAGPLVVMTLLPPYYPAAGPREGGLGDRLRPLLARAGVPLRPWYPFISDASYVSWRDVEPTELAAHLPELGDTYHLPIAAARALDLDVVNLGPWGRDAHGLYERVRADHAFGILPGLIAEAVRGMIRDPQEDA